MRSPALLPGPVITAIHLRELAALTPRTVSTKEAICESVLMKGNETELATPLRMLERLKEQGVEFPHTAAGAKSRQGLGISVNINSLYLHSSEAWK